MTGQKLCDPGHYKDPRVFLDTQEDYSRAQLSLSESFSDQNMSLMLQQHDLEGLCAATRSVTGEYLTEDEQVKFYACLCAFHDTYVEKHKKPTFNKPSEYKILTSVVASLSQDKYKYGNQYRLYTSLETEIDRILTVIKPQVYNKSAILMPKKPKCVLKNGKLNNNNKP